MGKPIMAICDGKPVYMNSLMTMFQQKKELPFEIYGFTKSDALDEFCSNHQIALLIISDKEYKRELQQKADQIVVLQETKNEPMENVIGITKYQSATNLYKAVMTAYADSGKVILPKSSRKPFQMIGIYSPIHRCLQTTFALTAGQILAEEKRTLYLSFECFSGLENLMGKKFNGNLTDLLYFYECDKEKLPYRLESVVHNLSGLDMVPPAESFEDFLNIAPQTWFLILQEIAQAGEYDILILDLTEQVRGLFQLLEHCDRIYTLTKEDRMAKAKLAQYELLLQKGEYKAVLEKTGKCSFPIMKCLPTELERLGRSELAGYARKILREDGFCMA